MNTIHVATPAGERWEHAVEQLRTLWEQGRFPTGTLYWTTGLTSWRPIAELFGPTAAAERSVEETALPDAPYTYTADPRWLTLTVLWLLGGNAVFDALGIVSDFGQLALLNSEFTEQEGSLNDLRQTLIAIGQFLLYLVTGVFFLMWVYRANVNCRGFGAAGMRFSPGWCVGYCFVPFLCLFRPCQCRDGIWRVSENPKNWKNEESHSIISVWWGLWLVSAALTQVYLRLGLKTETIEDLRNSTLLSIACNTVEVLLDLAAFWVIKAIADRQMQLVTRSRQVTLR